MDGCQSGEILQPGKTKQQSADRQEKKNRQRNEVVFNTYMKSQVSVGPVLKKKKMQYQNTSDKNQT